MIRECLLALALPCVFAGAARADPPTVLTPDLRFVLAPELGSEAGITSVDSLTRLLWLYEAPLAEATAIDESTTLGQVVGAGGRLLKLVFVDMPIASLSTVFVHEVFGHGSRARELGGAPTFNFRAPAPYDALFDSGPADAALASTDVARSGNLDYDTALYAGGIDANQLQAAAIDARVVRRGGAMHYGEALTYFFAKTTYFSSLANPRHAGATDDVSGYVRFLALRFGRWQGEAIEAVGDNLQRAYLSGGLLDWTLWWSFFRVADYLATGDAIDTLPLIEVGSVRLLPNVRFALSPFGPEHALEVLAGYDGMQFGARVRTTFSGLASAWGAALEAQGVRLGAGLELGASWDVWSQPELVLEQRGVLDHRHGWGTALGLELTWTLADRVGLTGKLSWKQRGYVTGLPLDEGLYGFLGLSIAFDDRPALITP